MRSLYVFQIWSALKATTKSTGKTMRRCHIVTFYKGSLGVNAEVSTARSTSDGLSVSAETLLESLKDGAQLLAQVIDTSSKV